VADDCIDQAVVYGEGRHFLTALIVPHWENLRKAIADCKLQITDSMTEHELARHPAVTEVLQKRIAQRLAEVAGYEQVKKFLVLPRPFTVAAGELTVSLKTRRRVIFEKHQAELEALYREGDSLPCR